MRGERGDNGRGEERRKMSEWERGERASMTGKERKESGCWSGRGATDLV